MKKVMVLFSAIVIAFAIQAGTVDWSMSQVYTYGSTSASPNSDRATGYIAYLLVGDSTSGMTALEGQGATVISKYVSDNNTYGGSGTTAAGVIQVTGTEAYKAADVKVYAVVFDAGSIAESSHFYVTGVVDLSIPDNGAAAAGLGKQKTGTTSTANWYSVASESTPEPTSGLLLMIGSAMLALRRRRA